MIGTHFQKAGTQLFVVACACAYYLLNAPLLLAHNDMGWHLAAGDLIRAHNALPAHDPWSFTAGSRQWFNLSWLWDVLASLVFQHAHFTGLLLLTLICGAVIVYYLASICLDLGASPTAAAIAVLCAALLYPTFFAYPNIFVAVSPNMATMVFATIFYGECLRATRRMLILPLLMVFWVNLHGGFLIGILILGVCCGLALLRRDWARLKLYLGVGCACLLASLVNPLRWQIYLATGTTVGNCLQAAISAWWPYYKNFAWPGSLPGIIYMVAFLLLELRRRGDCPLEARILSWLFLGLGFYQFRYIAFFFLFSAVPMALDLSRLQNTRIDIQAERALGVVGLAITCLLPVIFLRAEPQLNFPAPMLSAKDAAYMQTHLPRARLLNHWNVGSLLIFRLRGAIPVFVDGRAATAYPDDLLQDYFKLGREEVNDAEWDAVLAKYRIDTVLWLKGHDALRRFLVGRRGWKEVYDGATVSIYTKSTPADR